MSKKKKGHASKTPGKASQKRASILLIEDESSIADAVLYSLKSEGFLATWAANGIQGLTKFKKSAFDLVILDVGLPDINGFELFAKLREKRPVRVIFLTARKEEVDRVAGLEMGADDYVTKPFSPRELSARVRAVLRRPNIEDQNKSGKSSRRGGFFEVNEEGMTVQYMGQALNLSKYEYLILKLLLERPGQIYSRERILDRVWGQGEGPLDRTVDAHIKRLRTRLKNITPDRDPISTKRGLGYFIEEPG